MPNLKFVINHDAPADWDAKLSPATSGNDLLQSAYWGSLLPCLGKASPIFLRVYSADVFVCQVLLTEYKLKINNLFLSYLLKLANIESYRLEAPTFIHVEDGFDPKQIVESVLQWMKVYSKSKRILSLLIRGSGVYQGLNSINEDVFERAGFVQKAWGTYLVDLSDDSDSVFKSFDHSARKGVRKAVKDGVKITSVQTLQELQSVFLQRYIEWSGKSNYTDYLLREAGLSWNHPNHSKHYRYFIAKDCDGNSIAVLAVYVYGKFCTEIFSARSPLKNNSGSTAQDLLHWEVILFAKSKGCEYFDLAGVSPSPSNQKEENILRFKKKWGGAYLVYPSFELQSGLLNAYLRLRSKWKFFKFFKRTK